MQYREFGKDKEMVSILGYGTMRLPILDEDDGRIDEAEAIRQIRYAIDGGVDYIDTAYPYHQGNSERLVAKALEDGYREKVKIATKCPSWYIKSREDMDKYLNEQLEKLNTDQIDFYLLHALKKEHWENYLEHDVFDFIRSALGDGRIRKIGFSFHDQLAVFKEILDAYDWDFCQIQYNLLDEEYQAGRAGLDYAYAKGIPVVVMEPLRGGYLVNKIPEDVQRLWDGMPGDTSPVGWCLRHVWNHPGVSLLLSGMNSIEQIQENLKEAELARADSLSREEKETISRIREIYLSRMKVPCTECGYCMPCPFGVNIPGNFAFYNEGCMFQDMEGAKKHYHLYMPEEKQPHHCTECGKCVEACPQGINIPARLKEVDELFGK